MKAFFSNEPTPLCMEDLERAIKSINENKFTPVGEPTFILPPDPKRRKEIIALIKEVYGIELEDVPTPPDTKESK